jgi:hypothetical protein
MFQYMYTMNSGYTDPTTLTCSPSPTGPLDPNHSWFLLLSFYIYLPYMRKNMQQFTSWVCDTFSPFLLALLIEQRGFILILPRVHIRCLIFIHLSVTLSYPSSSCPFKNTLVGLSILYSYIHLEGLQSHLPSYHPSPIPTGSFPPNSPLLYSCHFLRSAFYVRKKCSIWLSESGLFHLT